MQSREWFRLGMGVCCLAVVASLAVGTTIMVGTDPSLSISVDFRVGFFGDSFLACRGDRGWTSFFVKLLEHRTAAPT